MQLKVEQEQFAALKQQHLRLEQQLQVERVQHADTIEWYVRTTGLLGEQLREANKKADDFRGALIDWHKYLTKQKDASKQRIDALETRNKGLAIECGTIISRNRDLEDKEAKHIEISNEHNEQNKSLRDELRTLQGLIGSLNALVDSTNKKLSQKDEDYTKLEEYVRRKQYSHVEEQSRLSARHQKDVFELHKSLSADCNIMLARTRDKAKKDICEKVKSIVTLKEHILQKEATDVDMQAELTKAKAEIEEKISIITMREELILKTEATSIDIQAKLIKAKAEIEEIISIITMREELILKTEATNIDIQAELDNANYVNLGIVDHLTTLKKTVEMQVQGLASKDYIIQNLEEEIVARNTTYLSDDSTVENDDELEVIDSEHSDDEEHLTPSRADIEFAEELNRLWRPLQGGVDISQYEEISIADGEDSDDGELVDFTDMDDD